MIEIIPTVNLTAADIKILRSISFFSISQIKAAADQQTSIRQFKIFEGNWKSERSQLAKIYHQFSSGTSLPYRVKETNEYGRDEYLSPEDLKGRLEHWRSIELETQMHVDLELGEIEDRDDFKPHDDAWF